MKKIKKLTPSTEVIATLDDIKYFTFIEALRYISDLYIWKINAVLEEQKNKVQSEWKFDEVMIYASRQLQGNIESQSVPPFYLNAPRSEEEGYDYDQDYEKIVKILQEKISKWELKYNTPILVENALWTEIDIQIILDIGFIIFVNKKSGDVTIKEFNAIQPLLKDLTYLFRQKILEKLF